MSTPQEAALVDARRGVDLYRRVGIPILGMVRESHRGPTKGSALPQESHGSPTGVPRESCATPFQAPPARIMALIPSPSHPIPSRPVPCVPRSAPRLASHSAKSILPKRISFQLGSGLHARCRSARTARQCRSSDSGATECGGRVRQSAAECGKSEADCCGVRQSAAECGRGSTPIPPHHHLHSEGSGWPQWCRQGKVGGRTGAAGAVPGQGRRRHRLQQAPQAASR